MKMLTLSLLLLLGPASLFAFTENEALELIEKAQRCCAILERYYQPAFEILKEQPINKPSLEAIGTPYLATTAPTNRYLEETSFTLSLDFALNLLTKLHNLLSKAKEVVDIAHTVVDGIEVLIKKLSSLRKTLYDYWYPQGPKKNELVQDLSICY